MTSSSPTLPTHDEIAQLAYEIWQNRGCPDGQDQELWLEAERQLNQRASNSPFSKNDDLASHIQRENESETTREHPTGPQPSPAVAAVKEAFATSQKKKDARSPQVPHHTSPPAKPLVSGKPVWPKGHSN